MISDTCRPMHYTWFVNSFSNANIFCKPSLDYFLSNIHLVKDKYKLNITAEMYIHVRRPDSLRLG